MDSLSSVLKRKRDQEDRLRRSDPTKNIIIGEDGAGGNTSSNPDDALTVAVESLNTLTGDVILAAGTNITLTPVGNTITIDAAGGGGAFTDLTDAPADYTGAGGKIVAVKADVSGLEFVAAPAAENGIPVGGAAGQILSKIDGMDYNAKWITPTSGGGVVPVHVDLWHSDSVVTEGAAMTLATGAPIWSQYGVQIPSTATDKFTCTPFALDAGTYTLRIDGYVDSNRGKIDFYLDDVRVVLQQDWAAGANRKDVTGIVISTAGAHILRAEINGTSGGNYYMCLSRFAFIKTA